MWVPVSQVFLDSSHHTISKSCCSYSHFILCISRDIKVRFSCPFSSSGSRILAFLVVHLLQQDKLKMPGVHPIDLRLGPNSGKYERPKSHMILLKFFAIILIIKSLSRKSQLLWPWHLPPSVIPSAIPNIQHQCRKYFQAHIFACVYK